MRRSGTRFVRRSLGLCLALTGAAVATVGSTSTTSFQDIADLTGARTFQENRWTARLVEVPQGSSHGQNREDGPTSKSELALALAVQTA